MSKIRELLKKHRELIMYLLFGIMTTAVGWAVYFLLLWSWKEIFAIPTEDTSSAMYLAGYSVAQVLQWCAAVLFSFFTSRKWVFTEADRSIKPGIQLAKFAGGRVVTFFVDYLVTFLAALGAAAILPRFTSVLLFGREWNLCEIGAKLLAAVIVIICNYVFSKLFVFKSKKS